jgi:glycosyltransferase involved in cell wall biosynthesis
MPHPKKTPGSVSVIIPLYNHEKYVGEAIESVLNQGARPHEIIVIDDGSTDGSAAAVGGYRAAHPEIIFWSQSNQGAHQAINSGIHRATGDIIAILNSDDAYHPARLAECLAILDARPAVSAVTTGLAFIDEKGSPAKNPWYENSRRFYDRVGDLSLALVNGNFFMTTSNLVIRRPVFRDIGYFSALRYAHDLDFFLRLLLHGREVHYLDRPLLHYRIHENNTIMRDLPAVKVEWAAVSAFFLYNLWRRPGGADGEWWRYLEKFTEITDRHGLTRLMVCFFAWFERQRPAVLDSSSFLGDREFARFIDKLVR